MADQDQSIFTSPDQGAPATPVTAEVEVKTDAHQPLFELPTTAAEYIGPGKKYGDVSHALSSIAPAQEHISNIEQENAQLRDELSKRKTAEETVKDIKATQASPSQPAQLDENAVAQMVTKVVEQNDTKKQVQDNLLAADMKMKELFGEKAGEKLAEKAAELNVGVGFLTNIAATSPKAFLEYFGSTSNTSTTRTKSMESLEAVQNLNSSNTEKQGSRKSIMEGASTQDLVNEWKYAGQQIEEENSQKG